MLALSLGSPITAATTIVPTHNVHFVEENNADIETITPPSPDFCGVLVLISDPNNVSNLSIGNPPSGNIFRGVGLLPGSAITLFYDPNTSKWYPHKG